MSVLTNMCRLCLSKDNLVWVFDKRFENVDSMKYVIYVTTGVQIHVTDAVSQKICEKCCHVIIKMFEFRKKSLENDKHLREKLKELEGDQATAPLPVTGKIKEEKSDTVVRPKLDIKGDPLNIHPTIRELFRLHPHLKLPSICLKLDMIPVVMMKMDEVEDYFKGHQLNFEDHCRLALRHRHTARKKTLGSPLQKRSSYLESPPCPINGQIIPQEGEGAGNGVLRPIKIKIIPKIPVGENTPEKTKELDLNKTAQCQRKRKLSDGEESPTKENDNPEGIERSTKLQTGPENSLSYVTNTSVPLHICNICDTVHYSSKDLKKHQYKHLRCQFCKTTFRTIESKTGHIENTCFVKKAMNNFPSVELRRIESNTDVVAKYRTAFNSYFPSLSQTDLDILMISSDSDTDSPPMPKKHTVSDIIEILSDDDSILENSAPTQNPSPPSTGIPSITSIVKPDVKIKGDPVIDSLDSSLTDLATLNKLLTDYKPLSVSTEKSVQTSTPSSPIECDQSNMTAVFTDLKQHLHVFRIPVELKNGPFEARYNYAPKKAKYKNLQLWNDLTPVDIKTNNTKTSAVSFLSKFLEEKRRKRVVGEETLKNGHAGSNFSVMNCNSNSADPLRPVSSTHSRVFAVGPSAASTFPSGKAKTSLALQTRDKQIVNYKLSSDQLSGSNNVADSTSKTMRISPPLQTINKQDADISLNHSSANNDDTHSISKTTRISPPLQDTNNQAIHSSSSSQSLVSESVADSSPNIMRISPLNKQTVFSNLSYQSSASEEVADSNPKIIRTSSPLQTVYSVSSNQSTVSNDIADSNSKVMRISPVLQTSNNQAIYSNSSNQSSASKEVADSISRRISPPLQTTNNQAIYSNSSNQSSASKEVADSISRKISPPLQTTNNQAIYSVPINQSSNQSLVSDDVADCAPKRMRISPPLHTTNKYLDQPPASHNVAGSTPQTIRISPPPAASNSIGTIIQNQSAVNPSNFSLTSTPVSSSSCSILQNILLTSGSDHLIPPSPVPPPFNTPCTVRPPPPPYKPVSFKIPSVSRTLNASNVFKDTQRNDASNLTKPANKTVRVAKNYWPVTHETTAPPTAYSVGYSNVPVKLVQNTVAPTSQTNQSISTSARRTSLPNPQRSYTPQMSTRLQSIPQSTDTNTYVFTAPRNYSTMKLNNRRNSVASQYPYPTYPPAPVQAPSYSQLSTTQTNNGDSFNIPITYSSPISQSRQPTPYSISPQVPNSSDNYYGLNNYDSTASGRSNTSQTSTLCPLAPRTFPSIMTASCSVDSSATGQLGQIRVKHMRELT